MSILSDTIKNQEAIVRHQIRNDALVPYCPDHNAALRFVTALRNEALVAIAKHEAALQAVLEWESEQGFSD